MSHNKAIKHGKSKRKPYSGSKAIDKSCRNHGSCIYCRDNRLYNNRKKQLQFRRKAENST